MRIDPLAKTILQHSQQQGNLFALFIPKSASKRGIRRVVFAGVDDTRSADLPALLDDLQVRSLLDFSPGFFNTPFIARSDSHREAPMGSNFFIRTSLRLIILRHLNFSFFAAPDSIHSQHAILRPLTALQNVYMLMRSRMLRSALLRIIPAGEHYPATALLRKRPHMALAS
jgi:hypothetical protein